MTNTDLETGEINTLAAPAAQSNAAIYAAWSQYCLRPIPASLDSKGHFGLFASYESGHKAFCERAQGLGLGIIQKTRCAERVVFVETVITHATGSSFSTGEVAMPVAKGDCAGFAASLSWAKRVGLFIGCFLPSGDPDDEGKPIPKVKSPATLNLSQAPEPPARTITQIIQEAVDLPQLAKLKADFSERFADDRGRLAKLGDLVAAREKELIGSAGSAGSADA